MEAVNKSLMKPKILENNIPKLFVNIAFNNIYLTTNMKKFISSFTF